MTSGGDVIESSASVFGFCDTVTSILERQSGGLDLARIREDLPPLLAAKEAPELADELERRIARHYRS